MKRLFVIGMLAGAFAACNPDIPQSTVSQYVTALFDPSVSNVPTPNLLATNSKGLLNVPLPDGASAAQADFVAFLNSLDGFPEDTPGKAIFDGLLTNVPSSITSSSSIRIVDIAAAAPVAGATAIYRATAGNFGAKSQITIVPPPTGWPTNHLIAIALIGGSSGLQGDQGGQGAQVIGSPVWGLVRSQSSLVTCTTLNLADGGINPECQPTVSVIPSNEHDPALRLQDQAKSAVQLEKLRLLYKPFLDSLEVARENVALAWTFKVTSRPQVPFDPANSVIPFPNDIVRQLPDGGTPHVNLPLPPPLPDGGVSDIGQLYMGLNTLDGFSTTAPIVTVFNADTLGALNQGQIDAGSLVAGAGWGFSRLAGAPAHPATSPSITACLDCADSSLPDGGIPTDGGIPSHPQRLQFIPNVPLDERTTYGVYITTNVTDTLGRKVIPSSAFALLRSENPLYDGTKSTVDLISDDQAKQLEPLRVALKPFITRVADGVGGRSNIALAWAFTTQTEVSALASLHGLPASLGAQLGNLLPATPAFLFETSPGSRVFFGEITTPQVLNGPNGTLSPTNPTPKKIWFYLALPSGSAPFPVTVFGHGLTRSRLDVQRISSAVTAGGQAVIATDVVWHGDRSSCAGSHLALPSPLSASDDFACIDPSGPTTVAGKCDVNPGSTFGRCIAPNPANRASCDPLVTGLIPPDLYCSDPSRRQGVCLSDMKCEGGDFRRGVDLSPPTPDPTPLISGWNIINLTNLFATRDNFRQQVPDLAQLFRVISATGNSSLNGLLGTTRALDPSNVNYAGQSLGGILGTLYTSVAPEVLRVVLNAAGGDFTDILLNAKAFETAKAGFLATLGAETPPIKPGSIAFDTFLGIAQWILDPADPRNAGYSTMNLSGLPSDRKVFIQYITRDQTIPNTATAKLIAASMRPPRQTDCFKFDPSDTDLPLGSRHGFLLNGVDPAVTNQAQTQVVNYLNTGTPPPGVCP